LHDALLGLGYIAEPELEANAGWRPLLAELAAARRATCMSVASPEAAAATQTIAIAAERLPQFESVFGHARCVPAIEAPAAFAARAWTREDALVEIVRSRLEGLGPVCAETIAESMALPRSDIDAALARLAAEGFVMQGSFTAGTARDEWCDRALLARIHRYTVGRLRQEIEPVSSRDFMRFLARWQHVVPEERRQGPDALAALITQLEGFEAPAAAWEAEILPARLDNYDFTWLDDLCLAGRAAWTRLTVPARIATKGAGPIRTTPVSVLPRRNLALWNRAVAAAPQPATPSARAQTVVAFFKDHGACFFDEIVESTGLLRTEVEDALAELVVLGLVHSDSFAGLRALLTPSERRKPLGGGKRRRRTALFGIEDAGRWALLRRAQALAASSSDAEHGVVEHIASTLLRRYGVVFWKLLEREAAWLPPWRELLRVLRRFEARGEVRGGRFVAGFTGEQFALPEAVALLRETRRAPLMGSWLSLSAADPLNLVGTVVPGPKVPALTANRVLYRDGVAVAALSSGEVQWIERLEPREAREAESALIRRQPSSPLLAYLR